MNGKIKNQLSIHKAQVYCFNLMLEKTVGEHVVLVKNEIAL